jgi:hypothetical protein
LLSLGRNFLHKNNILKKLEKSIDPGREDMYKLTIGGADCLTQEEPFVL